MKRLAITALAAGSLLLAGCATTVSSDVTTFHQWPAQLSSKTYSIDAPAPQDDTLDVRRYLDLVRAQMARLGFQEAGADAALKVKMRFRTTDVPVNVVQAVDPFFYSSARYGWGPYRRGWRGGYYGGGFYDPFWGGPGGYQVVERHVYQRDVQVAIRSAVDGKPLFDVTVHNNSSQPSTPALMPALVQSAFEGFPGPNGGARRVELKLQNG
jgi:Domain of unknown function (DUF4136)